MNKKENDSGGPGLIEYFVVLIVTAITTITVRYLLGPLGSLVDSVVNLFIKSPLVGLSAIRSNDGNDVIVAVTVSKNVTVKLTDLKSQQFISLNCDGTCQGKLRNVGKESGTVVASVDWHELEASYPATA